MSWVHPLKKHNDIVSTSYGLIIPILLFFCLQQHSVFFLQSVLCWSVLCLQTKAYFLPHPVVKGKPSQLSSVPAEAKLTLSPLAPCPNSSPESSECAALAAPWQRCTYFENSQRTRLSPRCIGLRAKCPGAFALTLDALSDSWWRWFMQSRGSRWSLQGVVKG